MGSAHVVEQLLFSVVPSILPFDFDLILGSFFNFWGPNGLFLGLGYGLKPILGSVLVVKHLLFSMISSILTFDFDLIQGSFLTFWCPNGLLLGSV